jgi:hypothetical protein
MKLYDTTFLYYCFVSYFFYYYLCIEILNLDNYADKAKFHILLMLANLFIL